MGNGNDGIKFVVDLENRNIGTPADKKLKDVEDAAHKANAAVANGSHEFSALKSNIFSATVAGELWAKGMEKGAEMVMHKIEQVGEIIKETVAEAAGERREQMAMTNLLGGREDAEKALQYLDRFGNLSEFNEEQTKAFGMELMNSGYAGQKWNDTMAAVADVASMSRDKIAGASEAVAAFSKMEMSGKLDARILKGLHLNVKDVMKDLGDALGMSPKAVKKALNEGAVPAAEAFEVVLSALEKKTGKRLGEAGLAAGKGLDAKLTHWREWPQKIMKAVADSPGMDKIEHGFDRLLEAFDPNGPKGAKMVEGLASLMDSVGTFMNGTNWKEVGNAIGGVATSLGGWVEPLGKIAKLTLEVTGAIAKLPKVGEDLGEALADLTGPVPLVPKGQKTSLVDEENKALMDQVDYEAKKRQQKGEGEGFFAKMFHYARTASEWRMGGGDDELRSENLAAFNAAANGGGLGRGNGAATIHNEAKAEVVVHVNGGTGSPKEVGEAVKAGTEEGMTKALEKTAIQRGTASARRKK